MSPALFGILSRQKVMTLALCKGEEPYLVTVNYGFDAHSHTFSNAHTNAFSNTHAHTWTFWCLHAIINILLDTVVLCLQLLAMFPQWLS